MAEVIISPNYGVRIQNSNLNPEYLLNLLEEKIPASEIFALDLESEEGNAIIFLSRAEYVYELIQDGIKSGVETLSTLPLISQYTISNVYPFFTNSFLHELFSKFGTVLKIECLTVQYDNTKFNHVISGRRLITFLLPVNDAEIILPKCVEAKIGILLPVEKHCCACFHDGHSMLECAELNNWYTAKNNVGSVSLLKREIDLDNVTSDLSNSFPDTSTVDYSSEISVDHSVGNYLVPSTAYEARSSRENCSSSIRQKSTSGLTVFEKAHCYRYLDFLLEDSYSVTKHASKILRKYKQFRAIKEHKRFIASCKSSQFPCKSSVGSSVNLCSTTKFSFRDSSNKGKNGSDCNKMESLFSKNMATNSSSNESEKNILFDCNRMDRSFSNNMRMKSVNNENEKNTLPDCDKIERSFSKDVIVKSLNYEREKNILPNFHQIEELDSQNAQNKNCDLEKVPISIDNNENEGFSYCKKSVNSCDPRRRDLLFNEEDSDSSTSSSSSLPSLKKILKNARNSSQRC